MTTLVALPTWAAALVSLAAAVVVFVAVRFVMDRLFRGQGDAVRSVAGPLMPALGAVFALLATLTLSNESVQLRDADDDIAAEAAAASRMAWASTSPGVATRPIQRDLARYLAATRSHEWDQPGTGPDAGALRALRDLERTVRASAGDETVGSATAAELYASIDALSSLRRQRLAMRAHRLSEFYLLVVLTAGLALVVDAVALGVDRSRRTTAVAAGLVAVVALVITLLLGVTAPFRGGFRVASDPVDTVLTDLEHGAFLP